MDFKEPVFKHTVGQLIATLKEFPEDMPIVVTGYEDGYENILPPKKADLKYRPDAPYWSGPFEHAEPNDKNTFTAIIIEREVRS